MTGVDDHLLEAEREHRRELGREAMAVIELRVQIPYVVRDATAQFLEEADDLEHARELAGLEFGVGTD
ncbi:hypothetical protein Htur_1961 [Haloterrigena turkmenica DSM 5511]|uniref:Uncharacterized protein n=1 Tax=Haloterrigena turkmenica (strain ATCC 51198 / DSM 5511 / JCM 9101 / NCIMB 13204 / VKM B-1734 / 4k) TaxID=543526 RepID=D2RSR9_HALTV|nr:hypothetical protein [Haloterrigena turkmenica]ADB60845.1 hypothetical protein Htur_1961 [Haloterrigena turkmenica DSM 5511]